MSFRRRALFLAGLFVAVSCSDAGNPIGPEGPKPVPPRPEDVMAALTCTVYVNRPDMDCAAPAPGVGAASGIFIGGTNGSFVRLTKTPNVVDADSMYFEVTLQNLIGQTLGVDSLGAVDPAGIRIFFETEPSVSGPGMVEVVPDGTAFFFDPMQPYFQYPGTLADSAVSTPTRWTFKYKVDETTPGAMAGAGSFTFTVLVAAKVPHPKGWLEITPQNPVVQAGGVDSLLARVRNQYGQGLPDGVDWTSSNTGIVTVTELTDSTSEITGVADGTAYVKAVSATDGVRRDSVLVTVNSAPPVQPDSIDALTNVSVRVSSARLRQGMAVGDSVVPSKVYDTPHGHAVVDADRGLTYVSDGGYAGTDLVLLEVTDGEWTVLDSLFVNVAPSNYWFVKQGATGDGSNTRPLGSLSAAATAAGKGDSIFVLRNGSTDLVGAAALDSAQAVIGHGTPASFLLKLEDLNETGVTDTIFQGQGVGSPLMNTGAATLTLNRDNILRGVNVSSADAAAIHGVGFGTLTVGDIIVQAGGPSLSLVNGGLAGSFTALHSTNSDSAGLTLQSVGGTLTATASSISGAATTGMSVTNGSVDISFPGAISHSGTGRVLDVNNHSGDATFQGAVTATAGTGALFNTASGAYTFNGAVTLSGMTGGFAGIDVRGGSTGTFSFPAGSSISGTSGPALYVGASAPTLTYAGTLSNNNNNAAVSRPLYVDGITGGTVTVSGAVSNTGAGILVEDNTGGVVEVSGNVDVSGSAGGGILVQNNGNGADIRFTGASKHIHSTSNITGVYLLNNPGAAITFAGGGLNIDMPSGSGASANGFVAQGGGTVTVTGANNVVNVMERAVEVTSTTIGAAGINLRSVTSSPTIATRAVRLASTGAGGLQITGAGAVAGSGGSITSVDTAVSLSSVGGPVELAYLTVGTGTTVGVAANTFNTLTLTGASLTTAGGPVLNLTGGALAGTAFLSAPNSLTSGAVLTNVTGSLTATGGGMSVSAVAGAGPVLLVDGGSVSVSYTGGLTGIAATPLLRVANGHSGTLALDGTNSVITTGSPGLRFENADGVYNLNVTAGTTALSGDSVGIDILAGNDPTNGSQGTFQFGAPGNGFAITSGAGTAFNFQGSAADVVFHGGITKNGAQTGRMVDITGQKAASAITFQTGTLSATSTNAASTGILLNDADGAVSFNGTTTLGSVGITTGDAGIDVENGSSGTITFAGSSSVVNAAGELIRIVSSAPTFTYPGTFQRTSGNAVGILAQNNTGGTITFNGDGTTLDGDPADVTKSLSTGSGNAVSLLTNTGTTFHFAGGMTLATTTGTTFNATGGGTVNVSGAGNTVTSTGGGRTVNIQNTGIGASHATFRSVTGTGAAAGVRVENTGTLGGFKITGDGSTASSGGIITLNSVTAADSAAFTLTNTAHLGLEFVRVEVTTGGGAGGIAANNLQGTNLIRNSVLDYNGTAPDAVPLHNAYGARFVQNNTNGTITLDGVSINGTRAGSSAGVLSAQGNSVVTFNVIDSNTGDGFQSLFTDLTGSGWVIGAGDNAGSTAVVNLTVRDSRFTNAAPNGTNNLEMSSFQNATLNYKIKDNVFQNVANASAIAGIINVNTLDAGRFGSTTAMDSIVGNTISNSGTGSLVADLGYIGIRVALENNVAGVQHRVVIANNTITDTWRQGMLLSSRGQNNGYNVRVENNTVGTAGAPVGQSNRRGIEVELQASAQMNIEILNNNVFGAGTVDAAAALGLRTGIEAGTATMNATVTGNTLRSTSGGTTGRFRAETAGTGTGVMCLDLRSNNLEDNSRTYALTHSAGTFRVEGAGGGAVTNASIQSANTAGNGNVSGTVLYNNSANCAQPAGL